MPAELVGALTFTFGASIEGKYKARTPEQVRSDPLPNFYEIPRDRIVVIYEILNIQLVNYQKPLYATNVPQDRVELELAMLEEAARNRRISLPLFEAPKIRTTRPNES